ncbi:MAG: hypothetical protein ABI867_40530 [Kofleriaceae bacterium]
MILCALTSITACATVTPVTPAPLSAQDAPALEAALIGQCHVTGTQQPNGAIKEARGIHWNFQPGGRLHQWIDLGFGKNDDFTYRLDGRNVVSNASFQTMRVDDWSGNTLKFFMYGTTETYYCTKETPATAQRP